MSRSHLEGFELYPKDGVYVKTTKAIPSCHDPRDFGARHVCGGGEAIHGALGFVLARMGSAAVEVGGDI